MNCSIINERLNEKWVFFYVKRNPFPETGRTGQEKKDKQLTEWEAVFGIGRNLEMGKRRKRRNK
ncbi:hypothetical protein [Lederbergia citrea]|uniref:Uncharacterized protein n=1 Tax=Lederbergia citrea TaxID=2833581 RepID=A0A942Z4M8_9BACI|nr:hypothetical protein [Lederbergia citrea]MBS4179595.1 hypothetical protein [Lederbergia citrea]MBS4206262.1 hypothetical protein [Lederbergia citrea]MBS4224803.1 hypothetical protein [Lederbergia citrea]